MKLEVLEYLPEINGKVTPLLFVHGAYHGAWCWKENFLPYFSSEGFPSYALSFRGHGESEGYENLHNFSLNDYVDDILDTMLHLKEKPVLIGHSMGGAIVQKLMHLHPDKIKAAVLIASVPPYGALKDLLRLTFTNFKEAIQMFSFNEKRDASFLAKPFFSKELPLTKKDEFVSLLQPESIKARKEATGRILPKSLDNKVPVLVLGSKKDCMISEKSIRRIGKIYGTEPVIFTNNSHDMMLDPNWKPVANQILDYLHKSVSASKERK